MLNSFRIFILTFHWTDLLQPQWYIHNGGLFLLLFVVFAETGLFAGFFLPGDSLLFVAGIYSNSLAAWLYDSGSDITNLFMIISLVTIAGIAGNTVGYWFGEKSGPVVVVAPTEKPICGPVPNTVATDIPPYTNCIAPVVSYNNT